MTDARFVAMLKGINVGKAKRVAMADLRAILSALGYHDVVTHLQSGNAVFSAADSAEGIAGALASALCERLDLDIPVVVRTHAQLEAALAADPYADIAADPTKHLLGFFSAAPDRARLAAFEEFVVEKNVDPEVGGLYRITGDHCYLWCPTGVSRSLFQMVDWDRKLGVTVTMRNWSTALKLLDLSR